MFYRSRENLRVMTQTENIMSAYPQSPLWISCHSVLLFYIFPSFFRLKGKNSIKGFILYLNPDYNKMLQMLTATQNTSSFVRFSLRSWGETALVLLFTLMPSQGLELIIGWEQGREKQNSSFICIQKYPGECKPLLLCQVWTILKYTTFSFPWLLDKIVLFFISKIQWMSVFLLQRQYESRRNDTQIVITIIWNFFTGKR